jgi:hypothetical protein
MTETRAARAERVLDRLGVRLGSDGLPDVDVGRTLAYAAVPDWIDADGGRAGLDGDRITEPDGFAGVVYDVPAFGVTVLVFDAWVVCPDAPDREVAVAALTAAVTKLAGAPIEASEPDVEVRTVPLTAGPDGEWDLTSTDGPETPLAAEADEADPDDDSGTLEGTDTDETDADEADTSDERVAADDDVGTGVGVTPPPCSGCGRVPDGWERYCPRCGVDLKPERCGACDEPLARWMLYCPACGADATEPR